MIIECPGCQETYEVEMPSVASDGIEIHCKHCNRSFLIRPHGAPSASNGTKSDDLSPSPPAREIASVPPQGERSETEFNESVFLQRDEIAYSIVQAYEEDVGKRVPGPEEQPQELWSPRDAQELSDEEPPEILLDPDEADEPGHLGGLAGNEYFSTPYPLGKDLVVGKRRRKRRRLGPWVGGVLATLLVVLVALFAGRCSCQKSWQRVKQLGQGAISFLPLNKLESGKIQISNLNGYFQDRAKQKTPVFVIEGNVTNRHKSPCHSIQVKGILFDERGNPAAEKVVYCGNVLTTAQIRSSSRKKIEQSLQNAYGSTLSNFNIEPGKSVPFMLVFFDPPEKLSEFSLEVHQYTLQDPKGG